jgi:hypothetical protein
MILGQAGIDNWMLSHDRRTAVDGQRREIYSKNGRR